MMPRPPRPRQLAPPKSKPRPCAFCGRIRVVGDTCFCRDTDCGELWRAFIKAEGEEKDRLRAVALRIGQRPYHPRTGDTPEQILARLAARLNCEPRQVFDRVVRMLEEKRDAKTQTNALSDV
jgi:hypothetical protein